jgi:hypothetical protein
MYSDLDHIQRNNTLFNEVYLRLSSKDIIAVCCLQSAFHPPTHTPHTDSNVHIQSAFPDSRPLLLMSEEIAPIPQNPYSKRHASLRMYHFTEQQLRLTLRGRHIILYQVGKRGLMRDLQVEFLPKAHPYSWPPP